MFDKSKLQSIDLFVLDIENLDPSDGRRYGGKATGLARMVACGIPVPPAFVISTEAFHAFRENGRKLPGGLASQVDDAIGRLARRVGREFKSGSQPLLVSVRSGAQVSMPGMMDTVLNLGLDLPAVKKLIAESGNAQFAIDTWMRFWRMYGEIVLGIDGEGLTEAISEKRAAAERNPTAETLEALEKAVLDAIEAEGETTSTDPRAQLDQAIAAVFRSWDSPRAKAYRDHHKIPHDMGTAVTVQAMVFGNADDNSGSGVAFTRNPNTGDRALYGEYLPGRQGEDLVSGAKTPIDLAATSGEYAQLQADLEAHGRVLEKLYGDAVDIEFTVEKGILYLLQVRAAKRTALAAVRIATDFVKEGQLDAKSALKLVSVDQIRRLLRPVFDDAALARAPALAKGIGSSPGHATGIVVVDSDRAAELAANGTKVILLRPTTSPLDIRGMLSSEGIVTARGGALSHAAVVSRALDKPCVVGCDSISVDLDARTFTIDGKTYNEGKEISIDGTSGLVFDCGIALVNPARETDRLSALLGWSDEASGASIWVPARDASEARLAPKDAEGLAVVCLTDVAISTGVIGQLAQYTGEVGLSSSRSSEASLRDLIAQVAGGLLSEAGTRKVHLRLPRPTSERARSIVPNWTELDPRIFLPMGYPAFYKPIVEGLAAAAASKGCKVSVLLGDVSDINEWRRFQQVLGSYETLSAGVAVQNIAGLDAAHAMSADGAAIWLDIDELIRSSHGFLSELRLASATFDNYVENGLMTSNPRAVIKPFMAQLLATLGAHSRNGNGGCVGIDLGTACDPQLIVTLYNLGFRNFSVPANQIELVRLLLGQAAGASR